MSKVSDIIFAGQPHKITSPYGPRGTGFHSGTDYGTYLKNLPQYAIEDGEIYSKGYEPNASGYYVWVKYPRINKRFLHCHLQKAVTLAVGEKVQRGTLLGYTGSSGNSTGIHLHLGVRDLSTNNYEDPEVFAMTYQDPASYSPLSADPVRVQMGYASGGDVKQITALLDKLEIPYESADGMVTTAVPVSAGDQLQLMALCGSLSVPCVIYVEKPADNSAELEKLRNQVEALEAENSRQQDTIEQLTATVKALDKKITDAKQALA